MNIKTLLTMKTLNSTLPLNFTRAQKAVRPTQAEIAAKIELANEKYRTGGAKIYEPSIYTR